MNRMNILLSSAVVAALAVMSVTASASDAASVNFDPTAPVAGVEPMALGDVDRDLVFTPVTPCRLLDTREAGGVIAAGATRHFLGFTNTDFAAQGGDDSDCGIPENAAAISVNLTMVEPAQAGYVTAYPYGVEQPLAASISLQAGSILSNEIVISLTHGETADFSLFSFSQAHAVADVSGYYIRPEATALDCTYVSQLRVITASSTFAGEVACPAGYSATGGACSAFSDLAAARDLIVSASEPSVSNAAAWWCTVYNDGVQSRTMRHMARCCRVPGR